MLNKRLKAVSILLAVSVIGSTLVGCSKSNTSKTNTEKKVNVYTWANYIPDNVIKDFEKKTGIKVNYATFLQMKRCFQSYRQIKVEHMM